MLQRLLFLNTNIEVSYNNLDSSNIFSYLVREKNYNIALHDKNLLVPNFLIIF